MIIGHQLIHVFANLKISEVPEMVTKNALIDPLFLSFSRIIYFVIQTVQDEVRGTLPLLNGIHKLHHRRMCSSEATSKSPVETLNTFVSSWNFPTLHSHFIKVPVLNRKESSITAYNVSFK